MAAPANTPQPQQTPHPNKTSHPMAKPASPGAQNRERERVSLLLEINRELLQEILKLQEQGKGGVVSQPAPNQDPQNPAEAKQASKEYIDCMRRLQANLSWLATSAERSHKPNQVIPPGPAIMAAPQQPQVLMEMYNKLQTMFPGWKGQLPKTGQSPGRQPGPPNP
ncbi:hypothetical protein K490DRAFT_39421 [Saccharata proteae CBS 121410]|uniref:Uncharacterized protein n=1 Tax=Saccharata proteae CBS 121410 TaxID=1314787 RepID=A0A9P4HYV2_9PEZI|nr:hypothetical protein K490DRAFT_39421 [Saccharata proteae CBS 121410]